MIIYFGADHRGYALKEHLKEAVRDTGYEIYDVGNTVYDEADDYPDFAAEVAKKVSRDPEGSRGIVICGSGAGMEIVANKFPNVRAALGLTTDQVFDARSDDDINVLSFAADFVAKPDAQKMVQVFLGTPRSDEERHRRRLEKISEIENRAPFS